MNNFLLNLPPTPNKNTITHHSNILLLGSCFVENIGEKLNYHKFNTLINPFGIIFHPEALLTLVQRIASQKKYTTQELFFHNDQWHNFEIHSKFSHPNNKRLLENLNSIIETTHNFLKKTTHVVLTYGTAWGYQNEKKIVANCHKVPQKQFLKKLSTVTEIEKIILKTCELIYSINPQIEIIGTVSPVKHIKDGIVENNHSKSVLLTAIHQVSSINYYPAYELVTDCLRDYRFFKPDLIHPNQVAINFIWEHFCKTFLHEKNTQYIINEIHKIRQGFAHIPNNFESKAHQQFLMQLEEKKRSLIQKYPEIEF